jgi:hypothetical protein
VDDAQIRKRVESAWPLISRSKVLCYQEIFFLLQKLELLESAKEVSWITYRE